GLLLAHLHGRDHRTPRAVPAPLDEALDRVGLALEAGLDVTVVAVADPAAHARDGGLALQRVPEEHPLHAAADHHAPAHDAGHLSAPASVQAGSEDRGLPAQLAGLAAAGVGVGQDVQLAGRVPEAADGGQ